jgi:hypothetical protein
MSRTFHSVDKRVVCQYLPCRLFVDGRAQAMPTVTSCKRFDGSSTYSRDFGPLGADPMQHATTVQSQQSLAALTRELNEGTTRAAYHPPGYTGFIPAACTNPVAAAQAAGSKCRADVKVRINEETSLGSCHTMFSWPGKQCWQGWYMAAIAPRPCVRQHRRWVV